VYRICKTFTIESGHMLSKHPERCKYAHGHTRHIELVLSAPTLDDGDMVCDFKWIKLAVGEYLDSYDHSLCVNANDAFLTKIGQDRTRVIVFDEGDPTTERFAKRIFDFLNDRIRSGQSFTTADGVRYSIRDCVRVERVRVGETPSSWAEYTESGD
jgi:6-pyruvoyltetrahydropterin/6-carboxytetrahydropterin synthase